MEHRLARRLLELLADIADWVERPHRSPWQWLKDRAKLFSAGG